jgi:hypothetical protein
MFAYPVGQIDGIHRLRFIAGQLEVHARVFDKICKGWSGILNRCSSADVLALLAMWQARSGPGAKAQQLGVEAGVCGTGGGRS